MINRKFWQQRVSLSTYFGLIVLIAILPVLLFSGVLAEQLVRLKFQDNERLLRRTADELAFAADQEIIATVRTLQGLTKSPSLLKGDLRAFHQQLVGVLSTQPSWTSILLHDTQANWLMSTHQPYGTKLGPAPEPQSILAVAHDGIPHIGKIIPTAGLSLDLPFAFAIRVPVKNADGQIIYVLSAILATSQLQELAARFSSAPGEWVRSVVDSNGTIAARTREPEKYVGSSASSTMKRILGSADSGLEPTVTLDQIPAYTAFRKAPYSGWYAIVAVRAEILETEARTTQRTLILISVLILVFSTAAAFLFSRWMERTLKTASHGAAMLARGETPEMNPTHIAELEELRHSLLRASDLLRSRDRAKSEFLANMSHELRTPLGIVLGMTELIASDELPYEERVKMFEIVKRNGQQLSRLIDDILDLAKIEANRLAIENLQFSVRDLISSVAEDFSTRALEKRIQLQVVFEDRSPTLVNSDPLRLRQIIFNLVGNAVKFTHQGSVEVRLHETAGDLARVTVTDTGIGITPQQQELLFSNFVQGDNSYSRKYGGSGLGLALSQKLARLLGGDVRLIRSLPEQGSVFEVTFQMS